MANISDDIIIYGPNRAENDKRLKKVLTRLKVWGPSLIKEKYKIYLPSSHLLAWYYDNVQDIGPTEEKVEALKQAREPQNRQRLRVF